MGALIPDRIEEGFDRLQPDWLRSKGIRLVLADLDNTLTRYRQLEPDPALITWRDELHEAGNTIVLITHDAKIAAQTPRAIHIHDGRVLEPADENEVVI